MNMNSTSENDKSRRTATESKPRNQVNASNNNQATTKESEDSKPEPETDRLLKLVEGPEPLWPLPVPDSKKVTNLD